MKKHTILLAAVFTLSALPVAACGGGHTDTVRTDPLEAFQTFGLTDGVLVKTDDGAAHIRWAEEQDAEKYILYHSPSRFGTYERLGEVKEATEFVTEEHIYDYFKVTAVVGGEEAEVGASSAFAESTLIASPNDDMAKLGSYLEETHAALETANVGQFSSQRAAILFLGGEYDLTVKVGYYTSVNGLGALPADVSLGGVYVSDRVLSNQNATCTFWRSVENVSVRSDVVWSVSQATSFRRAEVKGDLSLSYGGWASGGFLANTAVTGSVHGSSQQQWMTRNTAAKSFDGGSYNMVYAGCEGNIGSDAWTERSGKVTNLETTERIAEKPFLYCENGRYSVFVPHVQENTKGVTWKNGLSFEAGESLPLDKFYIADARYDTSATLNAALDSGKHLLFTPGNYLLDEPLEVKIDGTVLLGIGYATLKISNENSEAAIKVGDVGGVRIADILVDAGPFSKNMVVVGTENSALDHRNDPTVLSDLYLRIGGVENVHTETETALVIHSNDIIGDNFWIWRADHSQGVAWEDEETERGTNFGNPAQTGIEVNGDRVICYALMVEHFEDFQTVWKGEDGAVVMYQSETPYRVPDQLYWTSHEGKKNGCASYKVDDSVKRHRGVGIGIYLVNYSNMTLESAIEVPEGEGIVMEHLITCSFAAGDSASITHVVNGYGETVGAGFAANARVPKYPI